MFFIKINLLYFLQAFCKIVFFLLISSASSAPSSDSCCKMKKVGDILYKLVESDNTEATSMYGCKDGCVYRKENEEERFCFTTGSLPVMCQKDRMMGWCYTGDCGTDQWPTLYPVLCSTNIGAIASSSSA